MRLNESRTEGAAPSRNTSERCTEEFGHRMRSCYRQAERRAPTKPPTRRSPGHPLPPFFCNGVASCFSEGLTNVSPFNAARMAGARSAWADCLRTSPTAPAEKVSAINAECAYMLQMIALHPGRSRRRSRAASRPSTPGITRSNTTTSGRRRSDSVTAVRPSDTAPTTSPTPPTNRQRFDRIWG